MGLSASDVKKGENYLLTKSFVKYIVLNGDFLVLDAEEYCFLVGDDAVEKIAF
jgi:hypothetical protein